MKKQKNNFMMGDHHNMKKCIKGYSIRKVENILG